MDTAITKSGILVKQSQDRCALAGSFFLKECIGALGDLGTFIPIVIGLVHFTGLDIATILVFAGLMNIVSGLIFRIPIAVQPMKALAALAIAGALTADQLGLAGMAVALILLILTFGDSVERLNRLIPRSVIRGIQLAIGAKLIIKAMDLIFLNSFTRILQSGWATQGLVVLVGILMVSLCFYKRWQIAALGLILMGFLVTALNEPVLLTGSSITLWHPRLISFNSGSLAGIWQGGLAQFPLTLLNSVFAVSLLASQWFPHNEKKTSPTKIAYSVGLMNLIACPFGAMPMCHGSGGLAGQYRFGARSGLSVMLLGSGKLCIGLLFGTAAMAWLHAFPESILGVFLAVAGMTLAQASGFWKTRINFSVAVITVLTYFLSGFLPAGFAAGWIAYRIQTRTCKIPYTEIQ